MEEVSSYKYLGIDIHHKLNWNYSIEKRINGGWKTYFGLENNCKATNLVMWSFLLSCMGMRFGAATSLESPGEILNKFRSVL